MSERRIGEPASLVPADKAVPRVVRSDVPPGKDYLEYRPYLRHDFFFSCAYCMMSEAEASAIRFVIDHYEPRKARPELQHVYYNLMYCCDPCNVLKGDRYPPPTAREEGVRFFRVDQDWFSDHFSLMDVRLKGLSKTGCFTIEALDLNRQSLRRLRDIRRRLHKCDEIVREGILGLRRFHIDQLPSHLRGRANKAIKGANDSAEQLAERIDDLLRDNARSALVDDDPEAAERSQSRASSFSNLAVLYPGAWRVRKQPLK